MDKNFLKGSLSIISASVLYSSMFIFLRIIGFELPFFFQCLMRNVLALVLTGILLFFFKGWHKVKSKDLFWFISRTLLGIISFTCFYIAVNNIEVGTFYFSFYAGFLVGGFLIGKLLFKEKMTGVKTISLVMSFLGLGLIYSFNLEVNRFFILLSLFSGISSTAWSIFCKKLSGTYSALQLSFIDLAITLLAYLVLTVVLKEAWLVPTLSAPWIATFSLGVIMVFTGLLIVYGFHYLEAQIGSLLMLVEIVFAIFLGFILYQEQVPLITWIGGLLIISALVILEASKLIKKASLKIFLRKNKKLKLT